MAREARKLSSKGLYYIELRGECLFRDDEDRAKFIELIEKHFSDGGKIYAYKLDDGKICMAVKESKKGISMTMKPITVSYARYFNKRYGSEGSIFADRFKSVPYESVKEIEEVANNLSDGEIKPQPKAEKIVKKTVKKAVKKTEKPTENAVEKKEEVKAEVKPAPKKNRNLPSWLL